MSRSFVIEFDFPLADNSIKLHLHAIVEPGTHQFEFVVHSFSNVSPSLDSSYRHLLPRQELKCIYTNGKRIWVHAGSEKETLLSIAIGDAIEKMIS